MSFFRQPRFWVLVGVAAVALLLLDQFFQWEVCRVEILPGEYVVRIHRWGKDLAPDQLVAPDESYKGVMLKVETEGRQFINPLFYSFERHKLIDVPPGQCLVLTRISGKPLSPERLAAGDILVGEDEDTCGVVAGYKPPGSYRLNPYAYSWEVVNAVEIRAGQVGVRTLKVGKDPGGLKADERPSPYVVPAGYRGVQAEPVQKGTHYLNHHAESIVPVDVQVHRVELTDIEFPSRDGFTLRPHVIVAYAVQPAKAAELLVRLSDLGGLHQEDATEQDQKKNEILQKIILPHVRGFARIEGSNLDAKDFITTEPSAGAGKPNTRERFQQALQEKVRPQCEELGLSIQAVTLGPCDPPPELQTQISARDLARAQLEKNQAQIEQYKSQQQLQATKALSQQATEKVAAETRLAQAKTLAAQKKEVEKKKLENDLNNAQTQLDAARDTAKATLSRARGEADVTTATNEAEVASLRKEVQGFGGAQNYAQYKMLSKMAPALSEIFASDDSEFARVFAAFLTGNVAPKSSSTTRSPEAPPMGPAGR